MKYCRSPCRCDSDNKTRIILSPLFHAISQRVNPHGKPCIYSCIREKGENEEDIL